MKSYFLALSLLLVSAAANAQYGEAGNQIAKFAPVDTIDTTIFECIYEYKVYDPVRDETRESYKILQYGTKLSMYLDYNKYRIDSVTGNMDKTKITMRQYQEIRQDIVGKKSTSPDYIIRDRATGILTVYDKVFIDGYVYTDSIDGMEWQLADETKTVCGYTCRKATCDFRGRLWTAWYSDIPASEGPWKFGGLPGLILEAVDSTGEISFSAISIRQIQRPVAVEEKDAFKTTREKFNKANAEYRLNPGKIIMTSEVAPRDLNGNKMAVPKNARQFFNPIEKE